MHSIFHGCAFFNSKQLPVSSCWPITKNDSCTEHQLQWVEKFQNFCFVFMWWVSLPACWAMTQCLAAPARLAGGCCCATLAPARKKKLWPVSLQAFLVSPPGERTLQLRQATLVAPWPCLLLLAGNEPLSPG